MTSKQTPGKVTLGMLKGKPITTSVPVIRYHASDDELEELYPSSDDEELYTPESDQPSTKSSPCKTGRNKSEDELVEGNLGRRSASVDGNLSEGTPPSDPWKMLSEIKGKITKTFEEKLSEIKSERKKNKRRSRENSSVSDSEDLTDITPTEDNLSEHQDAETSSPIKFSKSRSNRFTGFYNIKTGLKTKNSEEDSVESGIEAAEFAEDYSLLKNSSLGEPNGDNDETKVVKTSENLINLQSPYLRLHLDAIKTFIPMHSESEPTLSQLLVQIIYQLLSLPLILWGAYHAIPLPEYFVGLVAGIFVTIMIQRLKLLVTRTLMAPRKTRNLTEEPVSVLEIPAAEEHAVLDRFEGWLNQLPYNYDPDNYHVARTISVYFRLEGGILKVMETKSRIPKRDVWDEPKQKVRFIWKKVFTLAEASVKLLPEGLIRRRRWSKKYPICVTFGKDALIESTSLNETSEDEFLQKVDVDEDGTIHEEDETDEDLSKDSKETRDTFEDCSEDTNLKSKMYIFARTDRQKEDWFRRLVDGVNAANKRSSIPSINELVVPTTSATVQSTGDNKNSVVSTGSSDIPSELSYTAYMARYTDIPTDRTSDSETRDVVWMNALIGRILYDLHKCPETITLIQDRIQRKMSNIKLPYFMESLLVSELVIGQGAPVIHKASQPVVDQRGLWLDLDISHEGCLTMTVETKVNLMKLTRAGSIPSHSSDSLAVDKPKPARSPMFDSDVEDSPETSTEEEDNSNVTVPNATRDSTPPQSSGRKFLNMVDKLAANKYFQHATEIRYIRRAMEGFSNTEIRLMVTVSSIEGCLVLNIPPSPSDRLWYGFRTVPKITLTAKPALGEKKVNIVYITNLIENKLLREFEKLVVLPNMDDLMIGTRVNVDVNIGDEEFVTTSLEAVINAQKSLQRILN